LIWIVWTVFFGVVAGYGVVQKRHRARRQAARIKVLVLPVAGGRERLIE
jgi:hypothetical protein